MLLVQERAFPSSVCDESHQYLGSAVLSGPSVGLLLLFVRITTKSSPRARPSRAAEEYQPSGVELAPSLFFLFFSKIVKATSVLSALGLH